MSRRDDKIQDAVNRLTWMQEDRCALAVLAHDRKEFFDDIFRDALAQMDERITDALCTLGRLKGYEA